MATSLSSHAQCLYALLEKMEQNGEIKAGDLLPTSVALARQLTLTTKKVVLAALELEIAEVIENVNRRFYLGTAPGYARNPQQVLLALLGAISSEKLVAGQKLPSAQAVSAAFGLSVSSYYDQVLSRLADWEIVTLFEKRPAILAADCKDSATLRRDAFRFSKLAHFTLAEELLHSLITDIAGRHDTIERWRKRETSWDNRQLVTKIFERFGLLKPRKNHNSPLLLQEVSPAAFAQQASDCLLWVNRHYRLIPADIRYLGSFTS